MLDLALPKVEIERTNETYSRFRIEPLEPGYGHTIGTALKRVLLQSLPGTAITKIRIDGVEHEFGTIPGVREDVTELVLNLKGVRLRSMLEEPVTLQLSKQGTGPISAGDISLVDGVTVVNPDLYLATITEKKAALNVELTVERKRGYIPVEQRDPVPIGEIPLDAMFTPILRVNYVVENTRIGGVTDYDRLVLEMWTDGTVDTNEALSSSAQIISRFAMQIAAFSRVDQPADTEMPADGITPEVYDTPIDDLNLTTRTYNCLKRADITKLGQLLQMDERDLLSVRNLGSKSIDEIKDKLVERGYLSTDGNVPAPEAS